MGADGRERRAKRLHGQKTRNAIMVLLCHNPRSVAELADQLELTNNAIRAQLDRLEKQSLARRAGSRAGVRKPHVLYELTEEARNLFPKGYELVLRELIAVLADQLPERAMRRMLCDVGRRLLAAYSSEVRGSNPEQRLTDLMSRLNGSGIGIGVANEEGKVVVRWCSCPLASITAVHPDLCGLAASLYGELLDADVREKCEKGPSPRCHFEISASHRNGSSTRLATESSISKIRKTSP